MSLVIPVAHDFICPWCYVAIFQAEKLKAEFDVTFDWIGYELFPIELEWPEPGTPAPKIENKPATPSRLDFMNMLEGIEMPTVKRPKQMRTHNAHEAVEYAKTEGVADALNTRLYKALWEEGLEINNPAIIAELATEIVQDIPAMLAAIANQQFKNNIIGFDDDAYANGVYNVPTFWIGGERYAEQPTKVLAKALSEVISAVTA